MIGITGSTGHLGGLTIQSLLDRGIEPNQLVAIARNPEKARRFEELGIVVRHADYDQPETFRSALDGIDQLLLISANEVGRRFEQHQTVIDAARSTGVQRLVYTSLLNADTSQMQLAAEHWKTEQYIRDAGIDSVILRNSWYFENYTEHFGQALEHGTLLGCADNGLISAASRLDYAEAAAAVLTGGSASDNRVFELGGDEAFTMTQLAEELTRQSGKPVTYTNLSEEAYASTLIQLGMPEPVARMLANSDRGIVRGDLFTERKDLHELLGRAPTSLRDAIAASIRS